MRCNPSARWGPGTTKERQADTEGTKEMKSKMEQMMAERAKQDTMWTNSETKQEQKVSTPIFSTSSQASSSAPKTTTSR
jgi:hypothetical protein